MTEQLDLFGDASGPPSRPTRPVDQADRDAIAGDLSTTMLVEAAAGTGKTTSMVGRMVAMIRTGVCEIGQMAAVTFTRKATAELRARFQKSLEDAVRASSGPEHDRLAKGLARVEQCFIGTIHAFCARLLRERPVEAGLDVGFRELDEHEEFRLREAAWGEHVARLHAEGSTALGELVELGIGLDDLRDVFLKFAEYPDVDDWPTETVVIDPARLAAARQALDQLADWMRSLAAIVPPHHPSDEFMPACHVLPDRLRHAGLADDRQLVRMLEEIAALPSKVKIKQWPARMGKGVKQTLEAFVSEHAEPVIDLWRRRRYRPVIEVLRGAAAAYDSMRRRLGVVSYQDLLMQAAALLRDKPHVRDYFRRRFPRLLVDEFQDTDPVQAEVMMLLAADDDRQADWRACRPRPGSLFVVGDPKQSIYRFRRADIVTYNEVRDIIERYGRIVALTENFRSTEAVIDWVNRVSRNLFPSARTDYAPMDRPMTAGRGDDGGATLAGVRALPIPPPPRGTRRHAAVIAEAEAELAARFIRHAIDDGLTVPRHGGAPTPAGPGDFMVLTWKKAPLITIVRRLQAAGLPVDVTGGGAVNDVEEASLLLASLRAVVETDDPVALVGALRSPLFGISDDELYRFRRGGGQFKLDDRSAVDGTEAIAAAMDRLRGHHEWVRTLQPAAAIERIIGDLGLEALAAAAADGRERAGGLGKAVELLRAVSHEAWTPAATLAYLDRLMGESDEKHDGVPVRPHEHAVRVMNLHQAKGLEAPVVLLLDASGRAPRNITVHIDRRGDRARGYLVVEAGRRVLAQPPDWARHEQEGIRFVDAEHDRLVYVAATRAAGLAVVSKPTVTSRWEKLCAEIPAGDELAVPAGLPDRPPAAAALPADAPAVFAADVSRRWAELREPTFAVERAKVLAVRGRLRGPAGEHGTEWGTVVHLLLEAAMSRPDDDLEALARAAMAEHDLDPADASHALDLVSRVTASDLWSRARAAEACLTEVPIQYVRTIDGLPTLVRGVIDLVFREGQGWVIVDYKTDDRPGAEHEQLVEHYAGQVRDYADAWHRAVREPVAERGLFLVRSGSYHTVSSPAGASAGS